MFEKKELERELKRERLGVFYPEDYPKRHKTKYCFYSTGSGGSNTFHSKMGSAYDRFNRMYSNGERKGDPFYVGVINQDGYVRPEDVIRIRFRPSYISNRWIRGTDFWKNTNPDARNISDCNWQKSHSDGDMKPILGNNFRGNVYDVIHYMK